MQQKTEHPYRFSVILLCSIAFGCLLGTIMGEEALALKPLGDIFINVMFMIVVPLVFVTVCSAIATMPTMERLGKVLGKLIIVFALTSLIAAIVMLIAVKILPPATGFGAAIASGAEAQNLSPANVLVQAITANDFVNMLSRRAMLPMTLFTIFFGICLNALGEEGRRVGKGIAVCAKAMFKMVNYLMYYAPIGLCAYFAAFVGQYGPQMLGDYMYAMIDFHIAALIYFVLFFTLYAWWATNGKGVAVFWKSVFAPAAMGLGICSGTATLPVNFKAVQKMGVPDDVSSLVLPLGTALHMEGSCIGGVLEIAFLFGIYGMPFGGVATMLGALGISILSGIVLSGVPGGGFVGEALIVSMYGFPPEAFPLIATIGILDDPVATMLNVTGDACSTLMVTKLLEGKDWFEKRFVA